MEQVSIKMGFSVGPKYRKYVRKFGDKYGKKLMNTGINA